MVLLVAMPAALASQGSKLEVTHVIPHVDDDRVVVDIGMTNKNSWDGRDIQVTFVLDNARYYETFPDLDTVEKERRLYTLPALSDGGHTLEVIIENDDVYYSTAFRLDGPVAAEVSTTDGASDSSEAAVDDVIVERAGLLDRLYSFLFFM